MKKITLSIFILALLTSLGIAYYFYNEWNVLRAQKIEATNSFTSEEKTGVIQRVSDLIMIPNNEIPTLAKINDLAPLRAQLFFAKAEVGDYVLVYAKAKRIILYRRTLDKIIEVGPLEITK